MTEKEEKKHERIKNMKFVQVLKKKKKPIIIIAIVLVLVIIAFASCMNNASSMLSQDTVTKRNLATYHTFNGNVTPEKDRNILAQSSAEVQEVKVSEGDEVKEGDVIAILNSKTISNQIKEQEASMKSTGINLSYALSDARRTYENYKAGIEEGTNAQLISAKASLDNAESALNSAKKNFNNTYDNLSTGTDAQVTAARQAVDNASNALKNAQENYSNNEGDIRGAEKGVDNSSDAGLAAAEAKLETLEKSRDSLQTAIDNATLAYKNAVENYNNTVKSSLNGANTLFDQVNTAQASYNSALASYNATVKTVEQTLESYKQAYDKAKATSGDDANQVRLDNLYSQLEDCTITAPMDGTITSVILKEGEMSVAGSKVATVTSFDKMVIDIKINEYDLLGAQEGKEVEIRIDAIEKSYTGTLSKISKVATVANGVSYFEAEVAFEPDEDVRSGMSVEIKLKTNEATDALTLLSNVVQYNADNTAYVMVQKGKKTENVPVTLGMTDGTYTEILSGLSKGDVVVYTPPIAMYGMTME